MSNFYGLYMRMVWLGPAFDVHSMFGAAECDGFRADPGLTPTPTFRRFRAENAARHAAEISGDSRRKICEKVLKNSAGHFLKIFEKYFSEYFPFKIPKGFKVKMLKFSPRATRAALPSFPVKSLRISRGKC